MPNGLAGEKSLYLREHADNPVDWYPWGEAALRRARTEDKPILLSIGYSACHWCHVMKRESFENPDIARVMNQNFVNIKVDREEHPELDSIYMEAVQLITGSGGWPLTVFLTPQGKPFFGGTYFPPEDGYGVPGFPRVLKSVAEAYRDRRGDVETTARQLVSLIGQRQAAPAAGTLSADALRDAFLFLKRNFDKDNGGFGQAPKFPQPLALDFLLRYFYRTGDQDAWQMVDLTLERMAQGGIYDQVGGGFHRYATDSRWQIPHFEKMLYDNALLSSLYLQACLASGKPIFRHITQDVLDYVLREMTDPAGGFYGSQDAESDGEEGKYYLWTLPAISRVVGKRRRRLAREYFGATAAGNLNGRNVSHLVPGARPVDPAVVAGIRAALLKSRERRVRPARDEKVLASWNGLMLASFAGAGGVLDRQDYHDAAVRCGLFLVNRMMLGGELKHVYLDGTAKGDGYLEDYATVIEGLLCLHQLTLGGMWLRKAMTLAETMVAAFWDDAEGVFYDTPAGRDDLVVRPHTVSDSAVPSGASAATFALLKLSRLTGNLKWEEIGARSLRAVQKVVRQHPLGFCNWLNALDFYLGEPREIAVVGPGDNPATLDLLRAIWTAWLPNKVVAGYDPSDAGRVTGLGLFEGRIIPDQAPTVYVCRHYSCQAPVTDPAALKAQLGDTA